MSSSPAGAGTSPAGKRMRSSTQSSVPKLKTTEVFSLPCWFSWMGGLREVADTTKGATWLSSLEASHLFQLLGAAIPPVPTSRWPPTRTKPQQLLLPSPGAPWGPPALFPYPPHGAPLALSSAPGSPLASRQGNKEGHYSCYKPLAGKLGPRGGNPAVAPARRAPQAIPAETCFSSTRSTLALFGYTTLAILKNSSAASRAMSRSCQSNRVLQSVRAAWLGSSLCGSQVKPGMSSNLLPSH